MKHKFITSLAVLALGALGFAAEAEQKDAAAKKEDHGNTIAVTSKNWEAEVVKSDKPVFVDFWAPWCGPCMKLGPSVVALSKEMTDVKFVKVNIDDSEDLAKQFDVNVIPYLLVLKDGKKIADTRGALDPEELKKFVADAAKKAK